MTSSAWQYFTKEELQCQCGCGQMKMDPRFMDKLVSLRRALGPLYLTSAYRCPSHNAKVSSTGLSGPHTTGHAVDIRADSKLKFKIVEEALKLGFKRVGIAKGFIHIDDLTADDGFPEEVLWTY